VDTVIKEQREEAERGKRANEEMAERVRISIREVGEVRREFELIRKPWAIEMNNIRKENEGNNREMNRIMGQIRDIQA
jgi:hypothetical protein